MAKAHTTKIIGKANTKPAALDALTAQEPDLVDRIFEYILADFPQIAGDQLAKAKEAVREEFGGEDVYIPARGAADRKRLVAEVLSLFNGRNATEIARRLGISRASVYRFIKQSRLPSKEGAG